MGRWRAAAAIALPFGAPPLAVTRASGYSDLRNVEGRRVEDAAFI
jgi:hypothetical protein